MGLLLQGGAGAKYVGYLWAIVKVYHSIDAFPTLPYAVATTGTFDGVHIGHQRIIQRLNQVAEKFGGESVLLTFDPHPRQVLQPEVNLNLLTTLTEKIALLEKTGLQHLIIHPFTLEFSRTSSLDFVRDLLVNRIGVKKLVIGYDHHFGRNREGSFEHLKEFGPVYGFDVEEISAQLIDEVAVSSTKVRNALNSGAVEQAKDYLGHPYTIQGVVTAGQQLGRTLGFPTANLQLESHHKLIPAHGVYAGYATILGRRHPCMCNIGVRPTLGQTQTVVEVHLLHFHGDIYHQTLELELYHRLRDEKKFEGLDALKIQLQKDALAAAELLGL